MAAHLYLLVAVSLAAGPPAVKWTSAEVLGWTPDGRAAAWKASVSSSEQGADGALGAIEFLVITDASGRIQRLSRLERSARGKVAWTVAPEAEALWKQAEPEEAAKAWLEQHESTLTPVRDDMQIRGSLLDTGGRQPLRLTVTESGGRCRTLTLRADVGDASGAVVEDRCGKNEPAYKQANTFVRISWSPDGSRAALSWSVSRYTVASGDEESELKGSGYFAVVSRRVLASIDLLDAGAGAVLDRIAGKVEAAGFRIAHRGKAGQPRKATEVYFAPGFEPEAKEVAKLAGAADGAVKPLSWKTPYAITVAVGAGK